MASVMLRLLASAALASWLVAGYTIDVCQDNTCQHCPAKIEIRQFEDEWPRCGWWDANELLGGFNFTGAEGGGYAPFLNIPQPEANCKIILRKPASTDVVACGIPIAAFHNGACFAQPVDGLFMVQYCCGRHDCLDSGLRGKKKRALDGVGGSNENAATPLELEGPAAVSGLHDDDNDDDDDDDDDDDYDDYNDYGNDNSTVAASKKGAPRLWVFRGVGKRCKKKSSLRFEADVTSVAPRTDPEPGSVPNPDDGKLPGGYRRWRKDNRGRCADRRSWQVLASYTRPSTRTKAVSQLVSSGPGGGSVHVNTRRYEFWTSSSTFTKNPVRRLLMMFYAGMTQRYRETIRACQIVDKIPVTIPLPPNRQGVLGFTAIYYCEFGSYSCKRERQEPIEVCVPFPADGHLNGHYGLIGGN